ncbi:hypothetical protein ACFQLX_10855 [Streptomyces polyrhachis]|uniref:Uncharacterized protein n=1 Tax=Streptomyces polyrhachis TaxID=1282885 RepID=A0ABW2GDH9_9ACTN
MTSSTTPPHDRRHDRGIVESNRGTGSWDAFGAGAPGPAEDPPTTRLARIEPDAGPGAGAGPAPQRSLQYPQYPQYQHAHPYPAGEPHQALPHPGWAPPPARSSARPHRPARALALLAVAALLGGVAGIGYGYHVQAGEPPTALPPLSQPGLKRPAPLAAGVRQEPLPAAQDHRARTGGDLRKLLVAAPKGTKKPDFLPGEGGWVSAYEFADDYDESDYIFEYLLENGYRRTAQTAWTRGPGHAVIVQLIQFRDEQSAGSADYAEELLTYLPENEDAGDDGTPIPGSGDGRLYVFSEPHVEAGYEPLWQARAIARRGDVVMDIQFLNTSKVSAKDAMDLARKQLERL